MKSDQIVAFVNSLSNILSKITTEKVVIHKPYLREGQYFKTDRVVIVIGLSGQMQGQVVLSMSAKSAVALASNMLEQEIQELDSVARSAIGEFTNMISANATIDLSEKGYKCDITPPSVIEGDNIKIKFPPKSKVIIIPIMFTTGHMDVNLAIKQQ